MGPTLPRYIVTMIINFPNVSRADVKFLERPTVAVALTVSYTTSRASALLVAIKRTVEVAHIARNVTTTATAFFTAISEIQRPSRFALFLFLTVANAEQIRTAMVTVFMPPAVPTGEPPISIKIIDTAEEAFVRFSCGTDANPAVLVVTDWKKDTWILSNKDIFPMVNGLEYSKINMRIAPIIISPAVTVIAIFE